MKPPAFKVVAFRTPEEKAAGALAMPTPLPVNYLLFFPMIDENAIIHMRGMTERLNVFFLDPALNVISFKTLDPGDSLMVPRNARHAVELSVNAKPPQNFQFLQEHVGAA
jgi:uncharacterized membrane protein (UPF0127 family)